MAPSKEDLRLGRGGGQEGFEYTVWGLALGVSQVWVSVLGV